MWSEAELAYLAGIIDGEGCITAGFREQGKGKTPSVRVRLLVANTDLRLMEWLVEHFGGAIQWLNGNKPRPSGWKPAYKWVAVAPQAIPMIEAVLPYLVLKRRQAEILLEMSKLMMPSSHGRKRGIPPELQASRIRLVEECRSLNRRGAHAESSFAASG